jgi:transposase
MGLRVEITRKVMECIGTMVKFSPNSGLTIKMRHTLSLWLFSFICENCGEHLDRDENAAKNILQFAGVSLPTTAGQAGSKGHGERVSRVKASAPARNARRSVNQPSSANV